MTHTEKMMVARLLKALATDARPGSLTPKQVLDEKRAAILALLPLVRGYDTFPPEEK